MQIVRALAASVDGLLGLAVLLPPVEAVRPAFCPGCGHPAYGCRRLGIVGHGVYWRQVLGLVEAATDLLIPIRRFLCVACEITISVLPAELHPGRWYAATVILEALRLHVVTGLTEGAIRARFRLEVDPGAIWRSWRSLRRWRGDPSEAIVVYKDTGTESTSTLIAYIDTAVGLPVTPDGDNITVEWDNGANKIFKL